MVNINSIVDFSKQADFWLFRNIKNNTYEIPGQILTDRRGDGSGLIYLLWAVSGVYQNPAKKSDLSSWP